MVQALSRFEFEVIHIPGVTNPADPLSRVHEKTEGRARSHEQDNNLYTAPNLPDAGEMYTPSAADLQLVNRAMYGMAHKEHTHAIANDALGPRDTSHNHDRL